MNRRTKRNVTINVIRIEWILLLKVGRMAAELFILYKYNIYLRLTYTGRLMITSDCWLSHWIWTTSNEKVNRKDILTILFHILFLGAFIDFCSIQSGAKWLSCVVNWLILWLSSSFAKFTFIFLSIDVMHKLPPSFGELLLLFFETLQFNVHYIFRWNNIFISSSI